MRDEFTFRASDNERTPESPMLFPKEWKSNDKALMIIKRTPRVKSVRDELTIRDADNE